MNEVIKLLKNINLWTIVGALIALLTLYFTFLQHKENLVTLELYRAGEDYVQIDDGCTVHCILLGFNNDRDRDDIKFQLPAVFKNDMEHGVDISFQVASPRIKPEESHTFESDGNSFEGTILQRDVASIPYSVYPDTEVLRAGKADTIDADIFWSYEKMAQKGHCNVRLVVTAVDSSLVNLKSDYKVIYAPSEGNPRIYVQCR